MKFPLFSYIIYNITLIILQSDPDKININELSLSFTERKAAKHQQKMENMSPSSAYEIWHSPPEVYDRIYGFESDCEPPDRHNISWNWLYKLWGYYSDREVRYRCGCLNCC